MTHTNPMQISTLILAGALACGLTLSPLLAAAKPANRQKSAAKVARIPDRLLTCSIRHVTNFDPAKQQTSAELNYDSVHLLTLFLPSIAVRTKGPPEPYETPELVDPRTRVIADPDHIAPQKGGRFDRVIDYWPERAELSATISGELLNVIVINAYDPINQTANLFMTRATELTHFEPNHIYQGQCKVRIGASATKPPMV
jgi:hypothetical protein